MHMFANAYPKKSHLEGKELPCDLFIIIKYSIRFQGLHGQSGELENVINNKIMQRSRYSPRDEQCSHLLRALSSRNSQEFDDKRLSRTPLSKLVIQTGHARQPLTQSLERKHRIKEKIKNQIREKLQGGQPSLHLIPRGISVGDPIEHNRFLFAQSSMDNKLARENSVWWKPEQFLDQIPCLIEQIQLRRKCMPSKSHVRTRIIPSSKPATSFAHRYPRQSAPLLDRIDNPQRGERLQPWRWQQQGEQGFFQKGR